MVGVQRVAGGGAVPPVPRADAAGEPATGSRPPTEGAVRAARVVVLGGSSMLLAGTAHTAGGGHLPGYGVLTVLALFVGLAAAALTRRRCRLPVLLLVLGVEQLVLHHLLDTAAAPACLPAVMPSGHGSLPGCPPGLALPAAAADDHALGWPMLTAHLLATLLTAWLLACGEAVLWRAVDQVARAAATLAAGWPASAPRPRPCTVPVLVRTREAWDPTAPRGPPTGCRAAR